MKKIGILKAMRLCGAYEKMNAEERCSLQARRLKELVEYARKNSPFISGSIVTYRNLLICPISLLQIRRP